MVLIINITLNCDVMMCTYYIDISSILLHRQYYNIINYVTL